MPSFLTRRLGTIRFVLVALAAAAACHAAASFNALNPNSGPNPTYIDFDDDNCPSSGNLGGSVTNGGAGLTLFGIGSLQGFGNASYTCIMNFHWQGSGSGAFTGTTFTVTPNMTFTVPADVNFTCALTVVINGTQEANLNCAQLSAGVYSLPAQTFPLPGGSLSSYSIAMAIGARWTDTGTTTFSVNIPGGTSIDILLGSAAPSVPALSLLSLSMTGVLLLSLAGWAILRGPSAGTGFPG